MKKKLSAHDVFQMSEDNFQLLNAQISDSGACFWSPEIEEIELETFVIDRDVAAAIGDRLEIDDVKATYQLQDKLDNIFRIAAIHAKTIALQSRYAEAASLVSDMIKKHKPLEEHASINLELLYDAHSEIRDSAQNSGREAEVPTLGELGPPKPL